MPILSEKAALTGHVRGARTEDEIEVFKVYRNRLGLELNHAELKRISEISVTIILLTDILRFEATAPLSARGILLCVKK